MEFSCFLKEAQRAVGCGRCVRGGHSCHHHHTTKYNYSTSSTNATHLSTTTTALLSFFPAFFWGKETPFFPFFFFLVFFGPNTQKPEVDLSGILKAARHSRTTASSVVVGNAIREAPPRQSSKERANFAFGGEEDRKKKTKQNFAKPNVFLGGEIIDYHGTSTTGKVKRDRREPIFGFRGNRKRKTLANFVKPNVVFGEIIGFMDSQ